MQQEISGNYRVRLQSIVLWTIVCALVPALMRIAATAFYKVILPTDPHSLLISNGMLGIFLCLPPLCVALQWCVLRRFAPNLSLWMWSAAAVVTWVASAFFFSWIRHAEANFTLALVDWRVSDAASFSAISRPALTFAELVGSAVLLALVTSLVQTLLLSVATELPWKIFLIAAVAGSGAEATVAYLPDWLGVYRLESLNGASWGNRLAELTLRACAGAAYGIASSFAIFRVLVPAEGRTGNAPVPQKVGLILSLATLTVICLPVSIAIIGRDGGRAAGLSVLKALTIAPAKDISRGEAVLQYDHRIETRPGRYPVVYYSPDSRYLIVLDRELRLMLVEVSSGQQLGPLGEALSLHDRYDVAWSPDSRAVVLRTKGAEDSVPGTKYKINRARMRKYSIPARELLGEYFSAPGECYESHAQLSLIYAPDGNSFWTLCDSNTQLQPESTMAIQLDAVFLRPLRRKMYGAENVAGRVRMLGISNGEVVYLQHRHDSLVDEVRLGQLNDDTAVLRMDNLNETGHTGGLLEQREIIEDGRILAEYCGEPVASEVADRKSICRTLTLDSTDGKVLLVSDDVDRRFERHRQVVSMRDGFRVEGRQLPASKKAEILVIDERNGKIRQRIDTREQHPLAFSPDKRWLVMYSPGTKGLNVYRVSR